MMFGLWLPIRNKVRLFLQNIKMPHIKISLLCGGEAILQANSPSLRLHMRCYSLHLC